VNYSSDEYTLKLPSGADVIFGNAVLNPADVTVWMEN